MPVETFSARPLRRSGRHTMPLPARRPTGPAEDVWVSRLVLGGQNATADVATRILDARLELSIEEASALTLTFTDARRDLLRSKLLGERTRLELDGLRFELVSVGKAGTTLEATFEDAVVADYRRRTDPVSAVRGRTTRVDFVRRLVEEFGGVEFVAPTGAVPVARDAQGRRVAADETQPGARDLPPSGRGVDGAQLTVKGVAADAEQRDIIARVLAVGARRHAARFVLETAIVTIIQESAARNLRSGDRDSAGAFQQRPSQGWGTYAQVTDPEHAAGRFFTKALAEYAKNPNRRHTELAQAVQVSGHPEAYEQWVPEAKRAVAAFLGGSLDDDAGGDGLYVFRRGSDEPGDDPEGTWAATKRLADEVQWRRFVVQRPGVDPWFVFAPDTWLVKARPVATVHPESRGVTDIDFTWDAGQPAGDATITCRADRWAAAPGSVIELDDCGPANGRWLVSTISRGLFSPDATITLVRPQPALPEPPASASTVTASQGSADERTAAMVDWALSKVAPPPAYQYGAKHGLSVADIRRRGTGVGPPFDCSSFVKHAYALFFNVDIGDTTDEQIARAQSARGVEHGTGVPPGGWKAGDLAFPNAGHVAMATGQGTMVHARSTAVGIATSAEYTASFFWARWAGASA